MEPWRPLSEIVDRRVAARRSEALRVLNEAWDEVAREGGRLVVFGSLVEGGFDEHSDLDVAIFGVRPDRAVELAAIVGVKIGMGGFEADVIPDQFLSASLRQRINDHGKEAGALE